MDICKSKHIKIFPKKYAATYSQSWDGKEVFATDSDAKKSAMGMKPSSHRRVPPPQSSGLDPTAPHLKYGLFPKKICINRAHSRTLTTTPSVGKPSQLNQMKQTRSIVDRQTIVKTPTVQTFLQNRSSKAHGEASDSPTFVFRPLEHRNLQTLTLSKSTHLDIKPKLSRAPAFSPPVCKKYCQNKLY